MKLLETLYRNPWARGLAVLATLVAALVVLWWRGPEWDTVYDAFQFVSWRWVLLAVLLNLVSVIVRAWAWNVTIHQAMPPPAPRFAAVCSAFGVGLLGNAVLPARAGELARVAVLRRHLPEGSGSGATLLGTVFAHRVFDVFPIALLVGYVLLTAKLPHWAVTGVVVVGLVGLGLLTLAVLSARRAPGEQVARPADRAPAARDGPPGPRSAARPLGGPRGDPPPDRRLDAPAPRRLGGRRRHSASTSRSRPPRSSCC